MLEAVFCTLSAMAYGSAN